jgi:putative membrane protein
VDPDLDDFAMRRLSALAFAVLLAPAAAFAHHAAGEGAEGRTEQALALLIVVALVVGALLYAKGIDRLWRKAGVGRGIRRGESMRFALGWAALAASLLSPVDEWTHRSFAVHMIQHELLMVVAAPLIVLGRPLEAWAWAVSGSTQRFIAQAMRAPGLRRIGEVATLSSVAWTVHALALWLWHAPLLFRAALHSPLWHIVQHSCFFFSALVYWWSVFGGRARQPRGSSIASLFTTMLHTSALGALLTFSQSPWYVVGDARLLGLSALEDQQLGGLVMWVPGGLPYLIAGLVIVARWVSPVSWRPRHAHPDD